MRSHLAFLALLAGYLIVAGLYAVYTPDWQAPDEPAHYNYVRQLAAGALPLMEPGDYDQAYQSSVIASRFDPAYSIAPFEYEDYQPPLYYLLATPVYVAVDGTLELVRLVSVLLGAVVVTCAYAIGVILQPRARWFGLSMAAFVAFLPQHVAMLASVNNDSLSEALIALMLLLLVGGLAHGSETGPTPFSRNRLLALGILLGLAFLTKVTAYLMGPVIAVTLLFQYRSRVPALLRAGLTAFVPALLLGLLWWGRNVVVYPGLDVLGTQAHDRVVVGQPTTAQWIEQFGLADTGEAFVRTSFQSFWGQFGWMGVPMPAWVYQLLLLFTLATVAGVLLALVRPKTRPTPPIARVVWLALLTLLGLNIALYVVYNLTYVQHQGRYLFASLIPIALLVTVGWTALLAPLRARRAGAIWLLPLSLAGGLAGLSLLALTQYIVPSLSVAGY